jgi:predicted anti-sigma-YlaC factor YlaD
MKCGKAQELFSSYLEKTIQPPMGVAFEQHLAECARCKAAYDRFHATTIVLDELPVVEPPPDLHAVIMSRVEQARREAPGRVKWLHFDWQSVFTLRIPAKALAAGFALLLVFVMAMQLTPLHSYVAGLSGVQRISKHLPMEETYANPPEPAGFTTHSGVRYADVGAGLSVGVTVDKTEQADSLYDIRLAAVGDASVQVRVYELPEGSAGGSVHSSDLTSVRYIGTVSGSKGATARIIQPESGTKAKVAMIIWKGDSGSGSELVYLPPEFGEESSAGISLQSTDVCEILSRLSADYGAVILAPAGCGAKTALLDVTASSAKQAMAAVAQQAGLGLRVLRPSVYVVR